MGSGESKEAASRLQQTVLTDVKFPNKFSLLWGMTSFKLVLGEDNKQPLKLISLHSCHPSALILYNGPTKDAEPIAIVTKTSMWGDKDVIELAAQPSKPRVQEELRSRSNGWSMAYAFVVAVDESPLREKFEWRSSRREETKELGRSFSGWKLVREGHEDEIVAVGGEPNMRMLSFTKAGAFQFVGRGATGELGDAWAVMAVVSFARILQKHMESAGAAAGGDGGGGGGSC